VAGESEWYIGQVVDVISSDNAVVNFMQKCHTDTFKWPCPPALASASSTTKTGRHDIAEILLKVALKHQNQSNHSMCE
jgi:hypothetical protein